MFWLKKIYTLVNVMGDKRELSSAPEYIILEAETDIYDEYLILERSINYCGFPVKC